MFRRGGDGRHLATVLFTDIVGSTERAADLGDRRWRELLADHHAILRRSLKAHRGREVDTAGDGFFATFERPADAIACAIEAIGQVHHRLGIDIRAGVHTGEVERVGPKVGGIAVHIGARVLSVAQPGSVVVTSTVRDLVGGSDVQFVDFGTHELKGVPEPWHLYMVAFDTAPEPEVGAAEPTGPPRPTGRRRPMVVGLAAGAAVVAIAGIAILALGGLGQQGGGPGASPAGTSAPTSGPNTAAALDPSGELAASRRVGRTPADIVTGGGRVWVANLGASTVTQFDAAGGPEESTIGGVGRPSSLAYDPDGRLWVLDALASQLSLVDAATGEVLETERRSGRDIAFGAGGLWVADELSESVYRIDPLSRQVAAQVELPPGSGPVALAVTDSAIWVAAKGLSSVIRIDPLTAEPVEGGTRIISPPTDIAAGPSGVWVASASGDALVRLDPGDGRVTRTIEHVCDEPGGVAAIPDGAWLTCRRGGSVIRFDATGSVAATATVEAIPNDVAVDGERAWVTLAAE